MKEFLKELENNFTIEEFTGHLGVLLGSDSDYLSEEDQEEAENDAMKFLQELYNIASKHDNDGNFN